MGDVIWKGPMESLVEAADSPHLELAEKATKVRTYHGLHSLCVSSALARGTVGTGDELGYVVAKSVVTREKGEVGKLVITWEASSSQSGVTLPPDRFGLDPAELNPSLKKHPRYKDLARNEKRKADGANRATNTASRETSYTAITEPLAQELADKIADGHDSFYMAGFVYVWTVASWTAPTLEIGGFLETPGGPLGTAIDNLGLSCLRQADALAFTGQYYEYSRSWLCAPGSHWDADIYD